MNECQHYSNESDIEKIYFGGKLAFLFNLIGQMLAFFWGVRGGKHKKNVVFFFFQNINRWFFIHNKKVSAIKQTWEMLYFRYSSIMQDFSGHLACYYAL